VVKAQCGAASAGLGHFFLKLCTDSLYGHFRMAYHFIEKLRGIYMKRVLALYKTNTKPFLCSQDIPKQRAACHDEAKRQRWSIVNEIEETGTDGFSLRQDTLARIKKSAELKEFDILLVHNIECVGVLNLAKIDFIEWLNSKGILVWSVSQHGQPPLDLAHRYAEFWARMRP
jgi:hypothetical protein